MMIFGNFRLALGLVMLIGIPVALAGEPLWTPVRDEVFLQEVGSLVKTEAPVTAVAVLGEAVFLGFSDGLRVLVENEGTAAMEGAPSDGVQRLEAIGGALFLITADALHRFEDGTWTQLGDGAFTDLCAFRQEVVVAANDGLYIVDGSGLSPMPGTGALPFPVSALAVHAETLYLLGENRLITFDGVGLTEKRVVEYGDLPEGELRGLTSVGSRLLLACDSGVGVLRGTGATHVTGAEGLPCEDVRAIVPGFAGDCWLATPIGAVRWVDSEFQFFTAARWLPSNSVNGIACGERTAYIATDGGLGIIAYEPYTLLKKAAYYERHIEEWGQNRMAFVHKLEWNPDKGGWVREVSDNDVGWTTHYWAAQAFKYAATGDAAARKSAVDGFNAMKWSEEISSIDGFPARAIWAVGETGNKASGGSGGFAAEWNPTPDGLWEWKGDTSSDETDGHFYYASIFHDLVANDAEKAQVREHINRVSGHIIENGWVLRDLDGKPTVWARWDPEYFAGKGKLAKGLNGLEILNYMRTSYALTQDERYRDALQELLDMNYLEKVIFQKLTLPMHIFHSDDRLAFYNYYTLLQYETDPYLRSHYMRSLERSWEIERMEQIPWFNFIYGALTDHDCETKQAVRHLRAWPLDLVRHSYDFTNRTGLATPKEYASYCKVIQAISPRELGPVRWTEDMGRLKGGSPEVADPSGWLDAYWMGRYYGFILPPETDDPELITVPERGLQLGAAPYDGPPMPDVLND